ncbi:MAG: glycosyltransferase family 4 protein [Planctomycetes bacterium]|nr:glycosyltransferase family 4 protein [Planctomycetota bacterium]
MTEALRIAMLTTFYPPHNFGGDGIGIQRLCRGLANRGCEVEVIHDVDAFKVLHRGPDPQPQPEPPGITVHRLESRSPFWSSLLTQQLGRPVVKGSRIRRILDDGRFDAITFNNVSLIGGPGLLSYGEGVKLYLAHEHWLVCPTHVLWRHGRERCEKKQCLRCQIRHRRPPQLWRHTGLLERQMDQVDAFVAMSEFSRRKHAEFGFGRDMEVLPYFLPDEEPDSNDTASADEAVHERPFFLFVGRLERIKGLDEVLPVFKDLEGADLLIAGDGEHAEALRQAAADNPRVRFLGRIAPETLARYYRQARALIVPSVCFETFGIILIEAFRQGTPVIARRLGPFPEIMDTAGAGRLFESNAELLAHLVELRDDPRLRESLGIAGRAAFARHWSESAVVPRFLDLVARIATNKGLIDVAKKARRHAETQA